VAKHKPQSRPEAVASVVLDRAIGMLGLVVLAVISLTVFPTTPLPPVLRGIRDFAMLVAIVAITSLLLAIYAGRWFEGLIEWIGKWPWVGSSLARMAWAVRLLRAKPGKLLLLIMAAVGVHTLLALTMYYVSVGLYPDHPTLTEHLYVVPPGMAAGAIPLAPGGLGAQEYALDELFKQLPDVPGDFSGIIVATVYRLITLALAGVGLVYYWISQGKDLKQAQAAAQSQAISEHSPQAT
jgi:hypothetical protein